MNVRVTLRYLTSSLISRTEFMELPSGITVGELTSQVIRAEEDAQDITFSGASIVTLVNGRIAAADDALQNNDDVRIMPVAAAG